MGGILEEARKALIEKAKAEGRNFTADEVSELMGLGASGATPSSWTEQRQPETRRRIDANRPPTLTEAQVAMNRAARENLSLPIRVTDGGLRKPSAYHIKGCFVYDRLCKWDYGLGFSTPEQATAAGHWPGRCCDGRY